MSDTSISDTPMVLKRTKIIATVGPATNSYESVRDLIAAGANAIRLNFSHGTHESHAQFIAWVRDASKELHKPVAIIQDLQGPKIRLGDLVDNHFDVHEGDEIQLTYGIEHDGGSNLPIQYDVSTKVKVGERVYIFDGKVRGEVTAVEDKTITVKIFNDGFLMSKKGFNLPDTNFEGDVITEKDYRDIDFGVTQDIDFIALSFVQSATDIELLRGYLATKEREDIHVIAKVETKAAIEDGALEHIVEVSDAVMVARGDLAVEVGAEIVPVVQRHIISLCQKYARISIVATQMMSSMVDNPEPTRAEVSDISTAVVFGADAVMLSDETANGSYPLEAVKSMKRVILHTQENVPLYALDAPVSGDSHSMAICQAAVHMARDLDTAGIIAETKSGATAQNISAHRPMRPVFSVTSDRRVAHQLALLYATKSFMRPDGEKAGIELMRDLVDRGFVHADESVVIVSGRQPGVQGGTDTIRIRRLEKAQALGA
ncbi:MAG TPA: pyruvate kinase [Patescibacteria group bacterium]|jgi:pyruvate kinase|nr:pyruvate kinase [Patescibacteria group bacterium]